MPPDGFKPHGIADREYWDAVRNDPRNAAVVAHALVTSASAPMVVTLPSATDFLAAKRSNNRQPLDDHWHVDRVKLSAMIYRRAMLGLDPADPDDKLLNWLFAFLTEPTWVVSAHLPAFDLPLSRQPQLDLAACEMAALLAETLEILKPWMDSVSGTLADSIIIEIDRRVLEPFAAGAQQWWADPSRTEQNNWAGICGGCILAACESLAAQGHPRPTARQRAIGVLNSFLKNGFTIHGECDEGMAYWSHGMEFACLGLSRLPSEDLSHTFDLHRLRQLAEYPRLVHLFADTFFSGNDAGLIYRPQPSFVDWLAQACDSPWLSNWVQESGAPVLRDIGLLLRTTQALCRPGIDPQSAPLQQPLQTVFLPDQQVGIFRAPTHHGALIVVLTGGTNGERHNHNDLGHFLVALGDKIIIPDLGAPHYTPDFFGPNRYASLPASSRGHCCPIINQREQHPGKAAAGSILRCEDTAIESRLSLDLTTAYPPQAGLELWTRTLIRRSPPGLPGYLTLEDTFITAQASTIIHVIWSTVLPRQRIGSPGTISFDLENLQITIDALPKKHEINEVDPAGHRLRDFSTTLYRIELMFETGQTHKLTLVTTFAAVSTPD